MIASVVVLSALVAVASSQYLLPAFNPAWTVPAHSPITGQPLDTPEVAVAKARHAVQWHAEASRTAPVAAVVSPVVAPAAVYLRKRREAPANEAPEAEAPETNNKDKRQVILPYAGFHAYSPLAYSAYSYPYSAYSYPSSAYLFRKRRDVSTETEEKAPEQHSQEKRQIITPWGYPSAYTPVAYSAYSYPYSAYPYAASPFLFRKRRDVSATEEDHSKTGSDEDRQKRQLILSGAYPYAFPYNAWSYRAYSTAPIAYYG